MLFAFKLLSGMDKPIHRCMIKEGDRFGSDRAPLSPVSSAMCIMYGLVSATESEGQSNSEGAVSNQLMIPDSDCEGTVDCLWRSAAPVVPFGSGWMHVDTSRRNCCL